MKNLKSFAMIFGIAGIVLFAVAQSYAAVDVSYSSDQDTRGVGQTFTVTATATVSGGPLSTYGGQINCNFDKSSLKVVSSEAGDFSGIPTVPYSTDTANTDGTFNWSYFVTAAATINDGTYTFGKVTFEVLKEGVTGFNSNGTTFMDENFGETNTGTINTVPSVTLTAGGTNTAPIATDGTLSVPQGSTAAVAGTLNKTDPDADTFVFSIVTNGTKGTATITDTATGAYTYTPTDAASATGTDTFTFKVNDGTVDSNTATVTVTFAPPANTVPVANDGTLSVPQGSTAAVAGTLSKTDPDTGDTFTFSIVANGTKGTAAITDAATGAYTYTPTDAASATGTDTFTFKVNDGKADSNTATVTVTFAVQENTVPVANAGTLSVPQGSTAAVAGTLTKTDPDADTFVFSIVTNGTKGTAAITDAATGAYTYTPTDVASATGTDTFTFKVNDGTVDSNTATVTITFTTSNTLGDADGNGTVNIYDALMVAKVVANLPVTGYVAANADVDCLNGVTIYDALLIAQVDAQMTGYAFCTAQ